MSELLATSIVALFDTNKEQRSSFVRQIINGALDGEVSMLKLHKQVKAMEEIVKSILTDDSYREVLLDEAQKHGKSFEYLGEKWSVKETGVKYDYSSCNDPYWEELMEDKAKLDAKLSAREEFLKSLTDPMTIVIESTGEIRRVYPPKKTSTTSVTLKMT